MSAGRRQQTPAGFGSPYWSRRILDAMHLGKGGSAALIEPVLEELVAQTRLDEASVCRRSLLSTGVLLPGVLVARIAEHRKDLRKAQRRGK